MFIGAVHFGRSFFQISKATPMTPKYNDNHPAHLDTEPWHEARRSGQYRFGVDVTGAKSWQCKFAGCTVYGLASREEALTKIRELRDEKLKSDFFNLDSLKM
jgi:hypothetical protein